jgi:diacylglycerol kinase family enzyme
VVKRVETHPRLKARARQWYYTWAAITAFYRDYLRNPIRLEVELGGQRAEGVTVIAQNSDPFTYFANIPIRIVEEAGLDDGTLGLAVLGRAAQRDMPTIAARVLSRRMHTANHGQIEVFPGITEATVRSISKDESGQIRPLPVQVDGDYLGEHAEMTFSVEPRALTVVA